MSKEGLHLIRSATAVLHRAGIPRPRWTAEQLLSHRLGIGPLELYLESSAGASRGNGEEAPLKAFTADVTARAAGVPLQYLIGTAGFWGREFTVGPGVFIPRPETEILVDVTLSLFKDYREHDAPVVVDVGTGSGAIAVTLALERPGLHPIATDRSSLALSFARRNAHLHRALVQFFQADLLDSFAPQSVDLIVANLPYLDPREAPSWPPELRWEPPTALEGGEEGLLLIRRLIQQVPSVVKPGGTLVLEIGAGQAKQLTSFAEARGLCVDRIVPDLAGLERILVLKKEGKVPGRHLKVPAPLDHGLTGPGRLRPLLLIPWKN